MRILVGISVVPDTTSKITFTDNNTKFNTSGIQFILNPYDELALTRALEIAEANNGHVTVLHVGLAESEAVIRKALSMGAHEAIRINAVPTDGQFVASQIANYVKQNSFDLIFTGRESIDSNNGVVCTFLGAELGWPWINVITKIEIDGNTILVERDIDGGREELRCPLPVVVSAQKDLCEPRIPNMKGIMAARTKPLIVVEPISIESFVAQQSFELPEAKAGVKLINPENVSDLVNMLRNEAKVI